LLPQLLLRLLLPEEIGAGTTQTLTRLVPAPPREQQMLDLLDLLELLREQWGLLELKAQLARLA
jgi:hypothetical protein